MRKLHAVQWRRRVCVPFHLFGVTARALSADVTVLRVLMWHSRGTLFVLKAYCTLGTMIIHCSCEMAIMVYLIYYVIEEVKEVAFSFPG